MADPRAAARDQPRDGDALQGVHRPRTHEARTYIEDDVVVSLLGNTLTKAEKTLAEEERPASVAELRRQFQGTLWSRACEIVADATGREVVAFMSDHSVHPDYAIEVFVLADADENATATPTECADPRQRQRAGRRQRHAATRADGNAPAAV